MIHKKGSCEAIAGGRGIFHYLLFKIKNIKIAQKKIFAFNFFAPFNFLFFEQKQKSKWPKNKRLTEKIVRKSLSGLSDDLIFRLYNTLYSFFKI